MKHNHEWKLIMFDIKREEGQELDLYQCRICKEIIVDTKDSLEVYHKESKN